MPEFASILDSLPEKGAEGAPIAPVKPDAPNEPAAKVAEPQKPEPANPESAGAPSAPADPVIPEGYIKKEEYDTIKKDYDLVLSDNILKELAELRKKGVAITHELLREGYKDYSTINTDDIQTAQDLVVQSYIEKGYSKREAELKVKRTYDALYNDDVKTDSEEYEAAEFEVKRAAKDYIEQKKSAQVKLKDISESSTNKEEIVRAYEAEQVAKKSEQQKLMKETAEDLLDRHKEVEFELPFKSDHTGDINLQTKVEITKEMKAQLKRDMQTPAIALAIYGKVDKNLSQEAQEKAVMNAFLEYRYPEVLTKLRIDQAVNAAVERALKGIKHPSLTPAPGGNGKGEVVKIDKQRAPLGNLLESLPERGQ